MGSKGQTLDKNPIKSRIPNVHQLHELIEPQGDLIQ